MLTMVIGLWLASPALGLDDAHYHKAKDLIAKSIAYLRAQQDEASGGWAVAPPESGQPNYPAITGLIVNGLIMDPAIDASDPAVARGVAFILTHRQPDGGIYDRILPSYNTAICVSALARVNRPEAAAAIEPAINFLRSLQWSEAAADVPSETARVEEDDPFFGGVGYGRHGRPDNSNLGFFVQALHDAGLSCEDPAYQRALVFLQRTQMDDRVNAMPYAKGSRQGGFIYATAENKDTPGQGQSQAGTIEETLDDGTKVSRLRAYGSMTYAGFKSMIYANLARDDQRVRLAYDWIRRNYTLEENPGAGTDGMYYYFLMMARALDAWGSPRLETLCEEGEVVEVRDWQNDLVDRLAGLQSEDGSFRSVDDRWMEDNPLLITAYSLVALQHVVN
jgi:squalene-hopene/tetraprenyl-beta-curcumene cyclase